MGTSFLAQNANKKSITLNLKKKEAKEIFLKLVAEADVVVENFRPGVMTRLGIGWDAMRAANPRLVYCAISGFGQDGPDADKPAYDQIIQGLSGTMAVNGDERLNPLRCGFPVCDTVGGLTAAFAIMTALYHRERTGEGRDRRRAPRRRHAAHGLGRREPPDRRPAPVLMGNDNFTAAPSGVFRTGDGYVNIAANKQEQWEAVCDALGVPELKTDPRFAERDTRKKNRRELTPLLEAKLADKPTKEWVAILNAKDVPSGEILSLDEALHQPQVVHRGTLRRSRRPASGRSRSSTSRRSSARRRPRSSRASAARRAHGRDPRPARLLRVGPRDPQAERRHLNPRIASRPATGTLGTLFSALSEGQRLALFVRT